MTSHIRHVVRQQLKQENVPFESAEQAWFWFISSSEARNDGARIVAGQGLVPRPCEPIDILRIVDRLYRVRRLQKDHLLVLRYYGRRHLPPDHRRIREMRACKIWHEAMARMESVMEKKGIVERPHRFRPQNNNAWFAAEGLAAE
jgi:hypothetical protein